MLKNGRWTQIFHHCFQASKYGEFIRSSAFV